MKPHCSYYCNSSRLLLWIWIVSIYTVWHLTLESFFTTVSKVKAWKQVIHFCMPVEIIAGSKKSLFLISFLSYQIILMLKCCSITLHSWVYIYAYETNFCLFVAIPLVCVTNDQYSFSNPLALQVNSVHSVGIFSETKPVSSFKLVLLLGTVQHHRGLRKAKLQPSS